jgi:succinyl-diaminopimelate desuccinylase
MQDSILNLTKALINIESAPDNLPALESILQLALEPLSASTVERFEHNGVHSALVYNQPHRPQQFRVLLNGHLDIIPGKPEQHLAKIDGDRLYGAGAMDMKANLACLIYVFRSVAPTLPYPIALQLTTDEEVGGFNGAKFQVQQGVRADFVLAGEPTNFDVVYQAKGILQLQITLRGVTAHGAYPWRGQNAIWHLHHFLTKLEAAFPLPKREVWETTINVARVATPNRALNKVPDECTIWLDIRFVPGDQPTIKSRISQLLPPGSTMDVIADESALATSADNPDVQSLAAAAAEIVGHPITLRGANGSSDARHFSSAGGAGVEFGPIGDGIGSDNEWVDIPSLETYCVILENFLAKLAPNEADKSVKAD